MATDRITILSPYSSNILESVPSAVDQSDENEIPTASR